MKTAFDKCLNVGDIYAVVDVPPEEYVVNNDAGEYMYKDLSIWGEIV